MAEKLVALYRVSTDKQGNSGLGLESQQHVVRKHVESVSGEIVHEFIEVISGRKTIRPQLEAATCGDSAAQTPLTEGQVGSWGQMPFQKSRNVAHRLLRLRDAVVPFKNMPQPLPDLQINLYTAFSKAA